MIILIVSVVIVTVLFLFGLIVVYFKWRFNYWKRKDIITPPTVLPFGNIKDILLQKYSFGTFIRNVYESYKPTGVKYCGYYFLASPQLLIFDLELIKSVLTKDFVHFTDHIGYVNETIDPLSGHLFNLKGSKWKNLRIKLTPTFSSGKMKMMFPTLVDCSDELIILIDKMVKNDEIIDIKDVVGRFTTDVIGSCAFGFKCNSLKDPNSEFRKYGRKIFDIDTIQAIKILLGLFAPSVLDFFKEPMTERILTKFFLNIVKETVNYREKNNVIRNDFIHLLIKLKNAAKVDKEDTNGQLNSDEASVGVKPGLSIEEITAQAFVFFLAGFETSSTTITFCLYELTRNLQVQNKLREEINNVLEVHDGKLTYRAIMGMTYMEKCINETLRKYPPSPFLIRECTKAYTIPDSNLTLEKGAKVVIPLIGIQNDPEYYPEPEKFDPERFSHENKLKRHPCTWLPFGEGPRTCIGLRFGKMEMKVALAVLLHNYQFTLNSKTHTPLTIDPKSFILSVSGGIWVNVERVSSRSEVIIHK